MITTRMKKKCTYIEIRFDDGSSLLGEGEIADGVWEHWMGCEIMNHIHGGQFNGIPLKTMPNAKQGEPPC